MSKKDATTLAAAPPESEATDHPTQPIERPDRDLERLPTTYYIDFPDEDRQTQIAQSFEIRTEGTLVFYDDDGNIVAAYHGDHWVRVQTKRQSDATPSA